MATTAKDLDPNQNGDQTKKTYHKQPTGLALATANAHSAEQDLKLYGAWSAPSPSHHHLSTPF